MGDTFSNINKSNIVNRSSGNIRIEASDKKHKDPKRLSSLAAIQEKIRKGDLRGALDATFPLLEEENTPQSNTLYMLEGRYSRIQQSQQRGTLTHDQIQLEENRISESLMDLLNELG